MVRGYNIYCSTENRYYEIEDKKKIFTCPANPAHTIDRTKISDVVIFRPNEVYVTEENKKVGGYLAVESIVVNAGFDPMGPSTTYLNKNWPFDITLLSANVVVDANGTGDLLNVYVNKNTVVGALGANAAIGATTFVVSDTVLLYTDIGFLISITDGVNTDELGHLIAVNYATNTITVQTPSTHAFSAASPTYVRMSIHMVKNVELYAGLPIGAGETNLSSSYVPANAATMNVEYTNMSTMLAKKLYIYVQYYY